MRNFFKESQKLEKTYPTCGLAQKKMKIEKIIK